LLVVGADGSIAHSARAELPDRLEPGDLLVANDAATVPASLHGLHVRTGAVIEVRLAGRRSLTPGAVREFTAVVFGAGDHRTRTEDRPPPPRLRSGDLLRLGPLAATILRTLGHPRFVALRFAGTAESIWAGIARHGKPIQYAHVTEPLALWDAWTSVAALPVAFEPPSAGFALDWRMLSRLAARGIGFATLTHAAGISSTGDPALDARLPLPEPYDIPAETVRAIAATQVRGGRIVALGTTVTRALEHAAARSGAGPLPGPGLATQRIGPGTSLRMVDAIVTGVHQPGDSHFELLRAFAGDAVLSRMVAELERRCYRSHEFGDSVLLARQRTRGRRPSGASPTRRALAPRRSGQFFRVRGVQLFPAVPFGLFGHDTPERLAGHHALRDVEADVPAGCNSRKPGLVFDGVPEGQARSRRGRFELPPQHVVVPRVLEQGGRVGTPHRRRGLLGTVAPGRRQGGRTELPEVAVGVERRPLAELRRVGERGPDSVRRMPQLAHEDEREAVALAMGFDVSGGARSVGFAAHRFSFLFR
jgi:S-adenosylmethionine:tRNA ribosyltransferase-isomerase